ncbi:MAG: hypothetical protein ACI92O_001818 [Colwellia sp.]|jgi:hypothetical protein
MVFFKRNNSKQYDSKYNWNKSMDIKVLTSEA